MSRSFETALFLVTLTYLAQDGALGDVPFAMEVLATRENMEVDFPLSIAIGQIDNDQNGLLDFASVGAGTFQNQSGNDYIAWFRNNGAAPPSFEFMDVQEFTGKQPASVALAYVDEDAFLDMIVGFKGPDRELEPPLADLQGKVSWFRNSGEQPPTFAQNNIAEAVLDDDIDCRAVAVSDLNGDGEPDLLVGYQDEDTGNHVLAWLPLPLAGEPEAIIIDPDVGDGIDGRMYAILGTDIDGDNDNDVVAALSGTGAIAWYRNNGGGAFAEVPVLASITTTLQPGVLGLHAADLNGDAHVDIISAAETRGAVAWYRNDGDQEDPRFEEFVP